MKVLKHEREIKDYELSVNILAEVFLNKQFREEGEPRIAIDNEWAWWAGDDVGGILVYGDSQYKFDDILTDIKEDALKGEIDKYHSFVERCANLGLNDKDINYRSWLWGAPHASNDELKHLEKLKERFVKEINKANGTDF